MARYELPEQQAFTSNQSVKRQHSSKQAAPHMAHVRPSIGDVITYRDSAGHVIKSETEAQEIEEDERYYSSRLPSSSRRYDLTSPQGNIRYAFHPTQVRRIPQRRSASPPAQSMTEERPAMRRRSGGMFRSHPLLWAGFGMLAMLLL